MLAISALSRQQWKILIKILPFSNAMRHEIQSALESLINRSNSVVTIILDYSSSLAIIFKRFQNLLFTVIITCLFYIRYFFLPTLEIKLRLPQLYRLNLLEFQNLSSTFKRSTLIRLTFHFFLKKGLRANCNKLLVLKVLKATWTSARGKSFFPEKYSYWKVVKLDDPQTITVSLCRVMHSE